MFNIKTKIGNDILNFGTFKDLYLEMKYTNTSEVIAECTYCFEPVGNLKITLSELEALADKNLLDNETNEIIKNFKMSEEIKYTEDGKAYVVVTEEMRKNLKPTEMLYDLKDENGNDIYAIPPKSCKHEFAISEGIPSDIRYCKKCIFWEWK